MALRQPQLPDKPGDGKIRIGIALLDSTLDLIHEAHRPQLQCGTIVFDLRIGADENELYSRKPLGQRMGHVQPVHLGHSHIADNDLRPLGLCQRQALAL